MVDDCRACTYSVMCEGSAVALNTSGLNLVQLV